MIQTYFAQIKSLIDQYAATSFVLEARLNVDMRPGDQGDLTCTLTFIDDSKLHVSEYLDQIGESVVYYPVVRKTRSQEQCRNRLLRDGLY